MKTLVPAVLALSTSFCFGCASSDDPPSSLVDSAIVDARSDAVADVPVDAARDSFVPDLGPDSPSDLGSDVIDTRSDSSCRLSKPYSSKDEICNACAEDHCCATLNTCLDDTRCNDDYVNCILACALLPDDAGADVKGTTDDCVATCGTTYPEGRAKYDAAISCVEAACPTDCK